MPFTDLEKQTILCEMWCLPDDGDGVVVTSITHLPPTIIGSHEPTFINYDMTYLMNRLSTKLDNANETKVTRARQLIAEWDCVSTNELEVESSGTGENGILVSSSRKRDLLRTRMGDLFGQYVPPGGFTADAARTMAQTPQGNGSSIQLSGDR